MGSGQSKTQKSELIKQATDNVELNISFRSMSR